MTMVPTGMAWHDEGANRHGMPTWSRGFERWMPEELRHHFQVLTPVRTNRPTGQVQSENNGAPAPPSAIRHQTEHTKDKEVQITGSSEF
jgi:hypothetical protein